MSSCEYHKSCAFLNATFRTASLSISRYNIPGEGGSLETGKRVLSFCRYMNVPGSSLDNVMTDVKGVRHRTKLGPNDVNPRIWEEMRSNARTIFAPPYVEVLENNPSPFVHLRTDCCSSRAIFHGGIVLLVGDASSLLRPHIALSTNHAAYQALLTERLMKGEINPEVWEYQVTKSKYLHWRPSV